MATVTRYRNGVPSWADVAVTDPAAGAAFYTGLFGWDAEDQGEEAGGYHMFRVDGRSVAGLGPKQTDEAMPLWSAYVSVADRCVARRRSRRAHGRLPWIDTSVGIHGGGDRPHRRRVRSGNPATTSGPNSSTLPTRSPGTS